MWLLTGGFKEDLWKGTTITGIFVQKVFLLVTILFVTDVFPWLLLCHGNIYPVSTVNVRRQLLYLHLFSQHVSSWHCTYTLYKTAPSFFSPWHSTDCFEREREREREFLYSEAWNKIHWLRLDTLDTYVKTNITILEWIFLLSPVWDLFVLFVVLKGSFGVHNFLFQ